MSLKRWPAPPHPPGRGPGQPLTKLNAAALACRWYSWFVARHEDDPGAPEYWEACKEHLIDDVWYRLISHARLPLLATKWT